MNGLAANVCIAPVPGGQERKPRHVEACLPKMTRHPVGGRMIEDRTLRAETGRLAQEKYGGRLSDPTRYPDHTQVLNLIEGSRLLLTLGMVTCYERPALDELLYGTLPALEVAVGPLQYPVLEPLRLAAAVPGLGAVARAAMFEYARRHRVWAVVGLNRTSGELDSYIAMLRRTGHELVSAMPTTKVPSQDIVAPQVVNFARTPFDLQVNGLTSELEKRRTTWLWRD